MPVFDIVAMVCGGYNVHPLSAYLVATIIELGTNPRIVVSICQPRSRVEDSTSWYCSLVFPVAVYKEFKCFNLDNDWRATW